MSTAGDDGAKARERERALLAQVVELTSDLVGVADFQGRGVYLNQGGRELLGLPPQADIGAVQVHDFLPESSSRQMTDEALPWLHREGRWVGEGALRRVDGREVPVSMVKLLLRDEQGQPEATALIARDLSEHRATEATREQLEKRLRHAQKMEAVATLAGGVAHDFNNMLTAMMVNVQLLQLELAPSAQAATLLADLAEAMQRSAQLVRQMLTFARSQERARQVVRLPALVEQTAQLARLSLPPGVELSVKVDASAPAVVANPSDLQQVLLNLLANAGYATRERGGRVEVALTSTSLSLEEAAALGVRAPCVRLSVKDDGEGMDGATRERAFEPFFTTKPVGEGTGLGLSVVHGIVEAHGGAVRVESGKGQGARFDVFLPAAQDGADAPAQPTLLDGEQQRVLLVDDEPGVLRAAEQWLVRLNYRVAAFTSPAAALEAFLAEPHAFHRVLTDLVMPHMGGRELARRIHAVRPELPVILTTGALVPAVDAQGSCTVLLKPFCAEELAQALRDSGAAKGPKSA